MKTKLTAALIGTALMMVGCERTPVQPIEDTAPSVAAVRAPETSPQMLAQLAAVRRATARFQNVDAALAAGYVPISACVAHPQLGGMGIHYGNPALLNDAEYSPAEPEILLYQPQADGAMKLVGVEYWITADVWRAAGKTGTPMFLDQPFDHDMANEHLPERYTLHTWVWQPNPSGMFAPFNPRVSCPTIGGHSSGGHNAH